jgi:hypothetical protein
MTGHGATTSVPIPCVVKASNRIECASLPSMMAALGTPAWTASKHAVILGIIPDSNEGKSASNSVVVNDDTTESVAGQWA